ncbi:BQ2448_7500 [Microbotryum intermedium]|uniref:BQ2448_7500 protein n=1 Tax=Microbotryum intermedium TaxID=269621 RepID=A0A238FNW7_9BASI|nr:BQ2448_7500 [Microbotryum intermedium]
MILSDRKAHSALSSRWALDTLSIQRWDFHRPAKAVSSMEKEMVGLKERLELRLAR